MTQEERFSVDRRDQQPPEPRRVTNLVGRKLMLAPHLLGVLQPQSYFMVWLQLNPQVKVHPHYKTLAGHHAAYSRPHESWGKVESAPRGERSTTDWGRDGTEPF